MDVFADRVHYRILIVCFLLELGGRCRIATVPSRQVFHLLPRGAMKLLLLSRVSHLRLLAVAWSYQTKS